MRNIRPLLVGLSLFTAATATPMAHAFHHENILGTSLNLTLTGVSATDAAHCERQVLLEISRLSGLLSTYDTNSEISHVIRGGQVRSTELATLLSLYDHYSALTAGAIHVNLGQVKALWSGVDAPTSEQLEAAFAVPRAYNVDALGKAYIIDRCVDLARTLAPSGLLNIGGDLRAWGDQAFPVTIADPANFSDNSPGLGTVLLKNAAITTSGSYLRPGHLINPRTLRPLTTDAAATVVATDCVTANAWSTALCIDSDTGADVGAQALGTLVADKGAVSTTGVLAGLKSPSDSRAFAPVSERARPRRSGTSSTPLLSDADSSAPSRLRTQWASPLANSTPLQSSPTTAPSFQPGAAWPAGHQVKIEVNLKTPDEEEQRPRKPFVGVWVEDEKGKVVRNIALWMQAGKGERWLPEMTNWWKVNNGSLDLARSSLTSATRKPGKYVLTWDGKDDAGNPVPQGKYRIWVEINREHGGHVRPNIAIVCGEKPATVNFRATAESDPARIEYGPIPK